MMMKRPPYVQNRMPTRCAARLMVLLLGASLLLLGLKSTAAGPDDTPAVIAPLLTVPIQVCFQEGVAGYAGTQDTYLDLNYPSVSWGAAGVLRASSDAHSVILIRFDLSSIPATAQIQSAELSLFSELRDRASPMNLSAYQVYRHWDEAQATWYLAAAGSAWGKPGCGDTLSDRSISPVNETVVEQVHAWLTFDITPLAQLWVNSSSRNHGVILRGAGDVPVQYTFPSSDSTSSDMSLRPRLCIEYTLPENQWGQIGGLVWHDLNGNGTREWDEPSLANARVELWRNEQKLNEFTTRSDGIYGFSYLPPDIYTVIEVNPPGYQSTTPDSRTVVVTAGATTRVDFGDRLVRAPRTAFLPILRHRYGDLIPTPTPIPQWAQGGALGGTQINILARYTGECAKIYAGVDDRGVYRSLNAGTSWERRGLDYSVLDIAMLPWDNGRLYAATWGGGVMASSDGGSNWIAMNAGLEGHHWLYAIALDAWRDSLYVATADHGVYKSLDAGASWAPANIGLSDLSVRALALDPQAGESIVYAGTLSQGLFKSTNGGAVWKKSGPANVRVRDILIDPSNPDTLFIATDNGVYRSLDGGTTWPESHHRFVGVRVNALAMDLSHPAVDVNPIVYAGREDQGVYRSTDGGMSWEAMNSGMPAGTSIRSLSFGGAEASCPTLYAGSRAGAVWIWP